MNETARYESRETTLEGGEGLLLYTDGVTEAFNAKGEIFSEARLAGVAGLPMPFGAHDLVENVLDELTKFVDGAEQSDDITLLALVRKETEVRREREKTFPADVCGLHDVQNFV